MSDRTCSEPGCGKKLVARKLCSTHWMAWRRLQGENFVSLHGNPVARFWPNVDKRGPDECWLWNGRLERSGYAPFRTVYQSVRFTKAHRFAYHVLVGPVPESLDLDHTCHTQDKTCRAKGACPHRRCCNPAHLEPVTEKANILRSTTGSADNARKTHCIHGHPFEGDNLIITKKGSRRCRACKREHERKRQAAKRAALRAAA